MNKLFFIIVSVLVQLPVFVQASRKLSRKPTISAVAVHHTVCFGRCPEYKVTVRKDGMVSYLGMRFSADSGIYTKQIGKKAATEIIDMVAKKRVDTCRGIYDNPIPDLPGLNFSVSRGKNVQRISNANYGPEFLKDAIQAIDALGTPDGSWKRIGIWDKLMER
jgi:hypothetical protein